MIGEGCLLVPSLGKSVSHNSAKDHTSAPTCTASAEVPDGSGNANGRSGSGGSAKTMPATAERNTLPSGSRNSKGSPTRILGTDPTGLSVEITTLSVRANTSETRNRCFATGTPRRHSSRATAGVSLACAVSESQPASHGFLHHCHLIRRQISQLSHQLDLRHRQYLLAVKRPLSSETAH
jgi:hypothetical protein